MSIDPVTPAEYPPWHDQDEEKDLKEHFDPSAQDAFGNEEEAEVKYKVLAWWYVPCRPWKKEKSLHRMVYADQLTTGNVDYVCTTFPQILEQN